MTASPKARRNRTVFAALSGVLVLVAAPLLGYLGWHVIENSKAGKSVAVLKEIGFPSTPTGMIAIKNDSDVVTALAVVVLAPQTGAGGTLVDVPVNASRAQTSDVPQEPISQGFLDGGADGLQSDLESLTRLTMNYAEVLDQKQATALFAPVGNIKVSLTTDVVNTAKDGTTTTLFKAGNLQLTAAQAVSVLAARDPRQPESTRLANVRAVWAALAQAVGKGIHPEAITSPSPTDDKDFVAHFLGGPVQVSTDLNVVPITGKENPTNIDVGAIDVPSVVLLMASLAPSAMIIPLPTLTFRVENGVTQADIDAAGLKGVTPAGVARDMVARLLYLQGNVISVSTDIYTPTVKAVPDKTEVFSAEGLESNDLKAFTEQLGVIELKKPAITFPLVNVVIVIGRSYLADMARVAAATPATTTTQAASGTNGSSGDSSATLTS